MIRQNAPQHSLQGPAVAEGESVLPRTGSIPQNRDTSTHELPEIVRLADIANWLRVGKSRTSEIVAALEANHKLQRHGVGRSPIYFREDVIAALRDTTGD